MTLFIKSFCLFLTMFAFASLSLATVSSAQTPTAMPATSPGSLQGDGNGDGKVDTLDYIVWLNHYGQSQSGTEYGDYLEDGVINGLDYIVWLNAYIN